MLAILSLLLPVLGPLLQRVIPDPAQAAAANIELQKVLIEHQGELEKAVAEAAKAQAEVNLAEAQSGSLFVGGWRPGLGWVCAAGCAYSFLAQPLLAWAAGIVSALAGAAIPVPPVLDMGTLIPLVGGMLGIAGLRTAEKVQGVAARRVK